MALNPMASVSIRNTQRRERGGMFREAVCLDVVRPLETEQADWNFWRKHDPGNALILNF